jgi:HK97 family phage portal protein
MLHIMNTSYNGIWGMHLIELAKDVFGLTQASQDATAITMANSGKPGILLEAPTGMFRSAKDAQEFLDNFNSKHEGISNSGRAGLLRDGMKATTVPISAADAQFLQQRGFQREEIALLFGLETIMGDNSGQTYRSISERNTAYINNCLQRWFAKWEAEIEDKLTNPARPMCVEFDSTPLAKGDPNSLADYSVKMQQTGSITINEIRAMHGLPPADDGDKLPHQIAMDISEATQPEEPEEGDEESPEEPTENEETNDETRE